MDSLRPFTVSLWFRFSSLAGSQHRHCYWTIVRKTDSLHEGKLLPIYALQLQH